MKTSVLYSNAVISCRENKMLNPDRIKRMVNSPSYTDATKILFECGYNEDIITFNADRDDLIINDELKKIVETFSELCTDEALKTIVLARYDYHNAKAIYKSKFAVMDLQESAYPFGSFEFEKLVEYIIKRNYLSLPEKMREALQKLDKADNPSSKEIDENFEKAMYEDIASKINKIKSCEIKTYYKTEIDFLNMKTFARCRLQQASKKNIELLFVEGGNLKKEQLEMIYNDDVSKIKSSLEKQSNYKSIASIFCMAIELRDLSDFEDAATNFLIKLSSEGSEDVYKPNMLFNWYILKLEELKIVKLILTGKKFNLHKKQLKDILKGRYEEFR